MKKRMLARTVAVAALTLGLAVTAVAKAPSIRIDPGFEGDPGGGFWQVPSSSGGSTIPHDPLPPVGGAPDSGGRTPSLTIHELGRLFWRSVFGVALPPAPAAKPAGDPRGGRQ